MEFIASNSHDPKLSRIHAISISDYFSGIPDEVERNRNSEFMNFEYRYGYLDQGNSSFIDSAIDHDENNISRVFLVVYFNENDDSGAPAFSYDNHYILGYFSLAPTSLLVETSTDKSRIKYPAIELVEFAKNAAHKDMFDSKFDNFLLGEFIYSKIILRVVDMLRRYLGIKLIMLYAADRSDGTLVKLYRDKYGFNVLGDDIEHELLKEQVDTPCGNDKVLHLPYSRVDDCTPMYQVL